MVESLDSTHSSGRKLTGAAIGRLCRKCSSTPKRVKQKQKMSAKA